MSPARAAGGVTAALLVVGAVVHYQPTRQLTSASLVSAALDVETLPACKAQKPMAVDADGAPTDLGGGFPCTGTTVSTCPTGDLTPAQTLYVEKDGPCVCGSKKAVCTNGRVCDSTGEGQCYLPRCPAPEANIPTSYTAGCMCASIDAFTSSRPENIVIAASLPTADCTVDAVATEDCKCGTGTNAVITSYCAKGLVCVAEPAAAVGGCKQEGAPADPNRKPSFFQQYAGAVPSIKSNVFTDASKFAICKSTAVSTVKCVLPTGIAPTQEGQPAAPKCEAQA